MALRDIAHGVLQATHGRATAFFVAFFATGNVLAFTGKLTPVYIGFMTALGGLVLGHSIKEDIFAQTGADKREESKVEPNDKS